MATPILGIAGGILGGLAELFGGTPSASALEQQAGGVVGRQFKSLEELIGAGPGLQDVRAGLGAQRNLGAFLLQLQQSGGLPSQQDITQTTGLAGQLFQGRRAGLEQAFERQRIGASRRAAVSGRSATDPVLANQLAQSQIRQESLLGAQQQAFGTSLALQLPGQRLGFASQRAQVLGGLGQQGLTNRAALLGFGRQVLGQEQKFRLGRGQQGGGLSGAIKGGFAGFGAGLSAANQLQQFNQNQGQDLQFGQSIFGAPTQAQGSFFGQDDPFSLGQPVRRGSFGTVA